MDCPNRMLRSKGGGGEMKKWSVAALAMLTALFVVVWQFAQGCNNQNQLTSKLKTIA